MATARINGEISGKYHIVSVLISRDYA